MNAVPRATAVRDLKIEGARTRRPIERSSNGPLAVRSGAGWGRCAEFPQGRLCALKGSFPVQGRISLDGRGEPVTNGSILKAKFARTSSCLSLFGKPNATLFRRSLVRRARRGCGDLLRRATKMVARTLFDLLS